MDGGQIVQRDVQLLIGCTRCSEFELRNRMRTTMLHGAPHLPHPNTCSRGDCSREPMHGVDRFYLQIVPCDLVTREERLKSTVFHER